MAVRNSITDFENISSIAKTLRFELRPVGDTLRNIEDNGILTTDTARAESYKKMKETIDAYHRSYIDRNLLSVHLPELDAFYRMYTASPEEKASKKHKDDFNKIKAKLRTNILKALKKGDEYKLLDKKELINNLLEDFAYQNDLYFDKDFKNFTTYFSGYNTNRRNMYTDEEKSTAIPYRLINENLPRFIDNIQIFNNVSSSEVKDHFADLYNDIEEYLNVKRIDDIFKLEYYPELLTQPQIDKYNLVIGGRKEDGEIKKIQGLNEYINLYNQQHQKDKLPKLKKLYKQILSDRYETSFTPQAFESRNELQNTVGKFYLEIFEGHACPADRLLELFKSKSFDSFDFRGVYIKNASSSAITDISDGLFGDYGVIRAALGYYYQCVVDPKYNSTYSSGNESKREKLEKAKQAYIKKDYYSIYELQTALDYYIKSLDIHLENYTPNCIAAHISSGCYITKESGKTYDLCSSIKASYSRVKGLINIDSEDALSQSDKDGLKSFLDEIMSFMHFAKPFYINPDFDQPKDERFYSEFLPLFEQLREAASLYDAVRNYVTKKPYKTEKIKINFDCGYLLNGWAQAQEYKNKGAFIIEQQGNYYLAILNKKLNDAEVESLENANQDSQTWLIEYHSQKPDMKNNPRLFIRSKADRFAPAVEKYSLPVHDIIDIYDSGKFKTNHKKINEAEFKDALVKMIDYYKLGFSRHESYRDFKFNWKASDEYNSIDEFYNDVIADCYYLSKIKISYDHLLELVSNNALYLFRIYNKDFSVSSNGKPNLHTMYWRALFEDKNLSDIVYKLSGQAQIFYRKASIKESDCVKHSSGTEICSKNPLRGKKNVFSYDLIKDRRYTVDKFMFHVPITMNFKARGNVHLNETVRDFTKNNADVNVIGIDRGERNLIYISLVDRNGHVIRDENCKLMQYHLNTINGEYKADDGTPVKFETPYLELLKQKSSEREKARKNWEAIENIKELKSGYLSQVVYHIAQLVVRYNAVIIMEDLNAGFKNSRTRFEQQVYQKFESALTQKLGYLVFKDRSPHDPGGLYHALQLAEPTAAYKDMRYQNGIIFYVDAWNTSKIDPVTGFVNLLRPKYTNVKDAQEFWKKFDKIRFDNTSGCFALDFDYNNFTLKAEGTRTEWTLLTYGDLRYSYTRSLNQNRGGYEKYNLSETMAELLKENGIAYESGEDLKDRIASITGADFHRTMIKYLQILLAMRYSCADDDKDFILSPVADESGIPFCSDDEERVNREGLPKDADANGAYNIARKGLLLLRHIDECEDASKAKMVIRNKEWLTYAQNIYGE